MQNLFQILFMLICIYLSFWSLRNVNFEKFIYFRAKKQIILLRTFLAISLGFIVSNFFLTMGNLIINFSMNISR